MSDHLEPQSPSPGRIIFRVVRWATLFLCIFLTAGYRWLIHYADSLPVAGANQETVVNIPKGASVREIGGILGQAGLVRDDIRFELLARWLGLAGRLRAGEFALPTGKTPRQLLEFLVNAKPYHYTITVPEGLRGEQIAALFGEQGWCDPQVFLELMEDKTFIERLGLPGVPSLEGYLFPDTYFLSQERRGAEKILTMLVNRFHEVWKEVVAQTSSPVDQRQTVIMASIVEKETGNGMERPRIAAVFLNRLKKGMKLQSDPTVVYGSGRFDQPITKDDLNDQNPYNTYVIPALPAGPIASPGRAALLAVLQPEKTEYLYFVSKNDGTHYFSTNLREHINAVNKFQRKNGDKSGKE